MEQCFTKGGDGYGTYMQRYDSSGNPFTLRSQRRRRFGDNWTPSFTSMDDWSRSETGGTVSCTCRVLPPPHKAASTSPLIPAV